VHLGLSCSELSNVKGGRGLMHHFGLVRQQAGHSLNKGCSQRGFCFGLCLITRSEEKVVVVVRFSNVVVVSYELKKMQVCSLQEGWELELFKC